jgi:arginine utilization protein RocB
VKQITIRTFNPPEKPEDSLQVRNNTEQLIADIVNATSEKNKKKLAKAIALAYNTLGWSQTDLHALLKKRQDPTIRNYTAFCWWSVKINNKV